MMLLLGIIICVIIIFIIGNIIYMGNRGVLSGFVGSYAVWFLVISIVVLVVGEVSFAVVIGIIVIDFIIAVDVFFVIFLFLYVRLLLLELKGLVLLIVVVVV